MKFSTLAVFLRKAYYLARPYGRKKLGFVFLVSLTQGLFQVVGVTSIFPFLVLASNPAGFRESTIGSVLLQVVPVTGDRQLLLISGIFALFMLLASNALMLAGEIIRTRYSHGFGHWLRLRLLNRMVRNPYGYFLQQNTGELLKKATGDVMAYVQGVLVPLLEGLARLITVGFLLLTLILVDPLLATIAGIGFTLFYLAIFKMLKARRNATSEAFKVANRGSMREAQQLLGGIKPVKVHGAEQAFLNRYAKHSSVLATLQKWFPIYQNSPRYLIEPLAFGGIVILVLVLSLKGQDLTTMLPTLGVMALAGARLIPNFQLLYGAATGITLMMHSLEEVYDEFINAESPERIEEPEANSPRTQKLEWSTSIQLEEVTFQYPSSPHPVINRLSLSIRKNEFVAFIGETGSGKSTLVDILLGLHKPQSGHIRVDDRILEQGLLRCWRAGIGYVPQEIFLLDDTIAANIAFGVDPGRIDMEQVRQVAEVAQIRQFIESELLAGFQSEVGERGVRLSGGQRQRIGLARALYHKPDLLILDEATSALDNATEAALMEAIESLYGQMTLIVIAHRLTTIQRADRIFVLKNGTVHEQGTFAELGLAAPGH